ncbi:hypothetical protein EU527_06780 [Candidatus Thorarchaeota archaeon]|nr:MAG: hypothetical protein EU527_06780 [Candidatus Thorarchaeota archaeon]
MKNIRRLIPIVFLAVMMLSPIFVLPQDMMTNNGYEQSSNNQNDVRLVDIGNGEVIELAPNEELHRFILTDQGWNEWSGLTDPLVGAAYGNSINSFPDLQMNYMPASGTNTAEANIPIGANWEAYRAEVAISSLTENRTWITNPGFEGGYTGWTRVATSSAGYSTVSASWIEDGHGSGNDCVEVDINSDSSSAPFYYDAGDAAWYQQVTTVNRGSVVWSALRLDFWADTVDDTHYGMTGSFRLYANIEGVDVWRLVFEDIDAEETWYNTGLITVNPNTFGLPGDTSITTRIGLLSLATVGYAPNIHPKARFDNVELFLKTYVNPSEINLQLNGLTVSNSGSRGTCSIIQIPGTPWTTSPVAMTFSWTPIPATPNPDNVIFIDFDVTIDMYARRYDIPSHYEINPTTYGERFTIVNGSAAYFTSYFRAVIPTGYAGLYFFNETIPFNRDVYFLAEPLAPTTNLLSGWTGGNPGDGYINVSTYDITSEPGRYGYWRVLSTSPNMISNMELYDPDLLDWTATVNLRAGDTSRLRVYIGSQFEGSQVNFTIYKPDASEWLSLTATVDATGYATTTTFTVSGATAPAGNWMVQAVTNNIGADSEWSSVGFFKRSFSITHSADIDIFYPTDAIGTMITNVTYGDLLLIILNVTDTDSSVKVPGGTMALDWVLGTDTFDDNGNGQYTKVIDTSLLSSNGQYIMDLDWTHPYFDPDSTALTINVNYAATLTSPDYPGISGPVGDDQSFTVFFKNIDGNGIDGGNLWCSWVNPYTVTPMSNGEYRFLLDMTGVEIDNYPVTVYASGSFIEPQSMLIYVQAREIYTSIKYTSNQLSIPVGEAKSFLLTWTDTDHSIPITGSASFISCNWTPLHSSGDTNYTVVETVTPGTYNITIYTRSDDALTGPDDLITVTFNVAKDDYLNHTFDIGIEIRKRNTLFVLDAPITQTPYGSVISILVFYQDTDLRVGITNFTEEVKITVTSLDSPTLIYSSTQSSLGQGHYNITLLSDQWGSIGWKDLTITIEWIGAVDKYYSQVIETSVRITGTNTDLYLELAPTATYYLDSFTFTIVYWDVIGAQRISNFSGNNVVLYITPLDGGHSVTQSDFLYYESTTVPGTYIFSLDSSLFPSTETFRFQLDFMWKKGVSPLYENRTITISLKVLDRPTYVDYSPVASTPFGEIAEFRFSFIDTLTSTKVQDSIQLDKQLNDLGVTYWFTYNGATREFSLWMDTSTLGVGAHVLHLNLTWTGAPFYASITSKTFTVNVILRATQVSHLSFAPGQWGNNITIEFIFTDIIAGTTVGMTGTLTLNVAADKYSVVYSPEGHFIVILNTTAFATDGLYSLTVTIEHTNPNYATAMETFDVSILKRSTQLGYDSPDPAPYQTYLSFIITYTDDSTGEGILGATVSLDGNSTISLVLNTNYWVTYISDGQYMIEVDTVALGSPAVYLLQIDVSFSGMPYYLEGTLNIIARVTQRTTQILITQTPGEVPFQEDVVIKFKYTDFLTGAKININQSHITLTHGSSYTVISSGQYSFFDRVSYYEIVFSSTLINPTILVTGHEIQIAIDKSAGVPYYALRSTKTSVTTIERSTQILIPLVEDTPYFDNIIIELSYIDYLTGNGIDGAILEITSNNWTVPDYALEEEVGGLYRIIINSSIFGDTGFVYFDISLSKSGSPFYASRTTLDLPARIKEIQTSMIAEAPALGSTAVGVPIVITLTLKDFDHNIILEGATILTDWSLTSYSAVEIGDGIYTLTIQTVGLLAQKYTFHIYAEKTFYETALATVSIQPGAATVEIYLEKTAYYADWGEYVNITFQVREPYYDTPVTGMTATMIWNGVLYTFSELENGYYSYNLLTSLNNFGVYQPSITVSKQYYQDRQKSFTLVVSKATGQILPESSIYEVVVDTDFDVQVFLNDTISGLAITTATATMEFNGTIYPLTHVGGGYYTGNLDVTGFVIGQYPLTIRAVTINHVFLETLIDIQIVPIYSDLKFADDRTVITVYFGDVVSVLVLYNDTYYNALIDGANVTYTLGSLTGKFTEETNHSYSAVIDISSLASQSIYLRITASKDGYFTAIKSIIVTILPIPTIARVDEADALQSGYYGDILEYTFYYEDLQHSVGVDGANVIASWEGGISDVTMLSNGTYMITVEITVSTPGVYDLFVRFDLTNYTSRTVVAKIQIYATPATIYGLRTYSIAINDTIELEFYIESDLDQSQITDINGLAISTQLGTYDLILNPSGNFTFTLPGTLTYGTYIFDIYFPTAKYVIASIVVEISVRQVFTELRYLTLEIPTSPNTGFSIPLTFWDLDHNEGISGATITLTYSNMSISYLDNLLRVEDGVYTLYFRSLKPGTHIIEISFSKDGYYSQVIEIRVQSDVSAQQQFQQNLAIGGGFGLLIVAMLIVGYVKVWSIPVLIRALNRMIRALGKGRVPRAPKVSSRQQIAMVIVNEDLAALKLQKPPEDIAPEPIITTVPEVNDLLEELASITGLGESEIEAFRADLARMKASERPGFLKEVIEQERARRADVLAKPVKEKLIPDHIPLQDLPGELEDLRNKLLKKGMAAEEIDIILEEAKSLSKADLDALLDSLGIDLD